MNLTKHLRKALTDLNSLCKAEKAKLGEGVHDNYKQRASKGGDVLWHVTIKGQKELAPGIPLHMSLKVFEDKKDMDLDEIKEKIKKIDVQTPNPRDLTFKTTIFTSERDGKKYYMLLVNGTDKAYSDFYEDFKHTGTVYKKFMPHITLDKGLYDKINKEGLKPEEICFGELSVEHGTGNTIFSFKKSEECEAPPLTKPYSSEAQRRWAHTTAGKKALGGEAGVHEWDEATKGKKLPEKVAKTEDLEKGAIKNILTAGSMAAALASPQTTDAKVPSHGPLHPKVSASPNADYSREKILNAISQVESSGGKNVNHKPTSMGTAWGKYALMPSVIQDTIRLNPKLKQKHSKALRLQGENLNRYMQDNPNLEQEIASNHLNRLEHHFGHNPEAIAFGWNQGVTGTNKALKAKHNISEHPYVKKFKQAYESEKKL